MPSVLRESGVTPREAQVLKGLGERLTNAEIADRLFISVRTVESHVSALLRKLDQPNRLALASWVRARAVEQALPLPAGLAHALRGPGLVGRSAELARLVELAARAGATGVRSAVVITGEAGIGKTRIAAEAAARLHAGGATILHGRCEPDSLVPYQAFADAARELSPGAGSLLHDVHADSDYCGLERYRLFEEFDLRAVARPGLAVLVIDDAQWIDSSGLELLRHMLHRFGRSPLVVLLTCRPEATEPRHPLASTLATVEGARVLEVLELGGLSLGDAQALADSLAAETRDGMPPTDPLRARAAWERTGGNPFLMTELLRHAGTPESLPTTARNSIVHRVAGLGPEVLDTLTAAAVVGELFGTDLVVAALDRTVPEPAAMLERAYTAGLLVDDPRRRGEYRFGHALIREALLATVGPGRRARMHLRVAQALECRGAISDAARHRHAALPDGDPVRAARSARQAGDRALGQLAFEVAASFADMELDAIESGGGDDADRAEAILRRGRARIRAGELASGRRDARAVRRPDRRRRPRPRAQGIGPPLPRSARSDGGRPGRRRKPFRDRPGQARGNASLRTRGPHATRTERGGRAGALRSAASRVQRTGLS
jgi:DNA-binding CsgD family transcriptional regulator